MVLLPEWITAGFIRRRDRECVSADGGATNVPELVRGYRGAVSLIVRNIAQNIGQGFGNPTMKIRHS